MARSIIWKHTKKITIFIPTTRRYRVEAMAKQLSKLDIGIHDINVLVIIDNNKLTKSFVKNIYKEYMKHNLVIYETGLNPSGEVHIQKRRDRIVNVLSLAQKVISKDTDFVFMIEDDTDFPEDALSKLLSAYKDIRTVGTKIGVISGIQVGRWGYRMLGAWLCDDPNDPQIMQTVPFIKTKIFSEVDAAGMYCFITPRHLFVSAKFEATFFGPDVNYGLELRRKGYRNFIDWTIETGHVTRSYTYKPDEKVVSIRFEKKNGKWKIINPEKKRND